MLQGKLNYLIVWLLIMGLLLGSPVALAAQVDFGGLYDELKNDPAYQSYREKLLDAYQAQGGSDLDGDIQALLASIETSLKGAKPENIDTEAKITDFIVGEALKELTSDDRYTPLANALATSGLQDILQGRLPPELKAVRDRVVDQILGSSPTPGGVPGGAGLPPGPGKEEISRDEAAGLVTWLVPPGKTGEVKDGWLALSLAGENVPTKVFSLPAALLDDLRRQKAGLELDCGAVKITLVPAALQAPAGAERVEVTFNEEDVDKAGVWAGTGQGYRPVSPVYTLAAMEGKILEGAGARIRLAGEAGLDLELAGVYLLEEGAPSYLGGRPGGETSSLAFTLPGPGRFIALEYRAPFADLAGHWAARDIQVMAARHLASGVANSRFEPDRAITRAEFTALLQRVLALPEAPASRDAGFSDVPADAWYARAVAAAVQAGLVHGYGDKTFRPDNPVTRAEMAAMLNNALVVKGRAVKLDPAAVEARLRPFQDQVDVPAWARPAVAGVIATGIMGGRDGGLAPGEQATRAEAVVMLRRLLALLLT